MAAHIIDELRSDRSFTDHVRHWETIPAREGRYAEIPPGVDERIRTALRRRGIEQLYQHQATATQAALDGQSFVLVTPTASGKTLSYNIPVLDAMLKEPDTRALYLFPTKALSQDQQAELNGTMEDGGLGVSVMTYDGDTPPAVRGAARSRGHIIISNPDMLHSGILPNHTKWVQFFQNLRYVVIDELHVYRGIFGSHVCNVIRRLKRVAAFYGSSPQFILCSATIGNPRQLAEAMVEQPLKLIDENAAPAGQKHIVLYNPPVVDHVQGIRKGIVHSARSLALRLLRAGVKTIVFARSRQRVELIASYIRSSLENVFTGNERIRVESYRGGYLPSERRMIERGLRDGSIHGVVSTNALELGIDIGGLDAAILGGFPGTVASSLQQAGRAGRRQSVSLAILVANASPLDQFVVEHPEYFIGKNPESAFINPDNPYVLFDHIKCAVFELPMAPEERFGQNTADMLTVLEENGVVRRSGGVYHWADQRYPAEGISLRSATSDNVVIVDRTDGRDVVIGEMDRPSAKELVFTNAIYIHRGEQFVVTNLDIANRRCFVERTDVNYFTDALVKVDLSVLTEDTEQDVGGVRLILGDVSVRSLVAKFKKIRFQSHENIGYGDIDLPEEQMHSRSAMLVLEPGCAARDAFDALPQAARPVALRRLARLLRDVAPAYLMSVGNDLGVHVSVRDPHFNEPAIFLFDRYPGGSGLSDALPRVLPGVLQAARERISRCGCDSGCPSCVGPIDAQDGWAGSPKAAVESILDTWGLPGGA